ncbi:MAG: ATP-binding cassette domain-containing protein, partial [Phycisphaerae bacterium]|nr:ATP-binding cassette domain-containing protein [Phycisphaerae bacterium]
MLQACACLSLPEIILCSIQKPRSPGDHGPYSLYAGCLTGKSATQATHWIVHPAQLSCGTRRRPPSRGIERTDPAVPRRTATTKQTPDNDGFPALRPSSVPWLTIRGARHNNLKNIDAALPIGRFTCVTGVSGSGKSSLVNDILYQALHRDLNNATTTAPGPHAGIDGLEHLDKIIAIDQSPIGRTPRSNPATYIKLFDEVRALFAKLPDAKLRGYKPGRFSFNVADRKGGGRCEACEGNGANKIEMDFLADVWVECPVCAGHRFSRETLQIQYKQKSISDVLEMDVQQALVHFDNIPRIRGMLQTLHDVGLDYIKIGQASTTLSGGEAQRIKLARELVKKATGSTMYVFDEPTTGLHFEDIRRLLAVLHGFVDAGNTVVVIEHNLDVIKCADWVIDLGPEGGD